MALDFTPSRPGQNNGSGDPKALFMQVYSGEVLAAFDEVNVMMGRHNVRTIKNGSSAKFPVVGKATAKYMKAGDRLTGSPIQTSQRVITIDDLLVSDVMIYDLDAAMAEYDVRSQFTKQQGASISNEFDRHVFQMGLLSARDTAITAGFTGGGTKEITYDRTTPAKERGLALGEAIFAAAEQMDNSDIPETSRSFYVRPSEYYALVQSLELINNLYGGKGAVAEGEIIRVAGFEIVKTNHLPNTVVKAGTTAAGTDDKYAGDFSNTLGLAMHPQAVGTCKLLDIGTEISRSNEGQGWLTVCKMAVGHGALFTPAAIEVAAVKAAPPAKAASK
ncbi:hypothetical protein [Iodobacter sp.]|uniref:hypothetical protein n=1 Tax=Iodobacter sp. TaxID=1915058 RepID=UPI0025E999ED|nr:hypothetical protein [Iodobacter sp.]